MAWLYILECSDGSYYVGSTTDLERRIWEHNEGLGAKYTARRRPVKLAYAAEFESIAEAYEREKQVQGWGRAKRKALIDGDYGALPELARKDFERGTSRLSSRPDRPGGEEEATLDESATAPPGE
jgi:putative endonuclease